MILDINLLKYKENILNIVKLIKNKIDNPSYPAQWAGFFFYLTSSMAREKTSEKPFKLKLRSAPLIKNSYTVSSFEILYNFIVFSLR